MQFRDLNEAQILALAITAEEEDARVYRDFADSLRTDFPAMTELFAKMAGEEDGHRHRLMDAYRQRFGEHIPLIRRQDVICRDIVHLPCNQTQISQDAFSATPFSGSRSA